MAAQRLRARSALPDPGIVSEARRAQDLVLEALEHAQHIVAEYPGSPRSLEATINQLRFVLDRRDRAAAQQRLKAGCGLRVK
jgi:hypothetical protein